MWINCTVLLGAAVAGLFVVGCAQAAPPQGEAPAAEVKAVPDPYRPDPSRCEPDKEWWRVPGPPIRGGVAQMVQTDIGHADLTRPDRGNRPGWRVYQELLVTRGCYSGDVTVVPYLAKAWEVSPDGLTWTLKLRDNVRWHNKPPVNGRPFTSADVGWSIDNHLAGSIVRSNWSRVESHREPDPHTVVLRLNEPDADFALQMAYRDNVMLAREVKEQYGDFKSVAIGTGPYLVREIKPELEITVDRNPDYWEMGVDGKPLPYLEGVHYVRLEYTAEVAAMRTGQLDVGGTLAYRKLDWEEMRRGNPKLVPFEALQATYHGVWFNHQSKPWDDVRVRKAVSLALEREDLVASNRGGVALSGFIPPFFKDYSWPEATIKERFKRDLPKAKALLKEAGYGSGDIKAVLKTSSVYAEDAEVVQRQLKELGIETTIDSVQGAFTPVVRKKEFDIATGVIGGSPLVGYFGGQVPRSGSSFNYWNLADPEVDRLADAQSRELDPAKRKQVIDRLQDRLYEVMAWAPTVSRIYFYLYSCRAKNMMYIPSNLTQNDQFPTHMWLDPSGC